MTVENRRYCVDLTNVVFVTNSVGGHRLTWFLNLYHLQIGSRKPVQLIFQGEIPSYLQDVKIFQVYKAATNQGAIRTAESLYKVNKTLTFIFLDGEQWVKNLIRTRIPSKVLIMRPFVSTFIASAFLNFTFKIIVLFSLSLKRNLHIRYLKIPHHTSLFRKTGWISDNLTTSDLFLKDTTREEKQEVITILVPGFINERKNPNLILEIAAILETQFPRCFQVSFLGSVDLNTRNLIDSSNLSNVSCQDAYYSRPEYLNKIRAADLILLLYKNRSASGIVMEALALNKTVLMHKSYLWSNLKKISPDKLVFISKKPDKAVSQIQDLVRNRQLLNSVTTSPEYEFLDENDPSGLIQFIFTT